MPFCTRMRPPFLCLIRYCVEQHVGLTLTLTITITVTITTTLRYCVEKSLGRGSFSTFFKCHDESSGKHPSVGLKVVTNNKDCLDTGCAEVRVLDLIRKHDGASHSLVQMHSFFYWREHLIIVTEVLHESLHKCYRSFKTDEDRLRFFDQKMMAGTT
jgi:hypothetical protein